MIVLAKGRVRMGREKDKVDLQHTMPLFLVQVRAASDAENDKANYHVAS